MTNAVDIRIFFRNGDTKLGIWPKRARSHCRWFKLQRQPSFHGSTIISSGSRFRYRLTPGEKNFFRAMAKLGPRPLSHGRHCDYWGVEIESLSPVRAKLIKKGMVYSPSHGGHKFNHRALAAEWEQVVDAWQLDAWETYRDVARLRRKTRLAESRREVLWSILVPSVEPASEFLDDLTCEPTSGKPVGRNRGREPWPTWCCRAPADACRLGFASHDCDPSSRLSVSVWVNLRRRSIEASLRPDSTQKRPEFGLFWYPLRLYALGPTNDSAQLPHLRRHQCEHASYSTVALSEVRPLAGGLGFQDPI